MIELVPVEARDWLAVVRLVDQLVAVFLLLVEAICVILFQEVKSQDVT